MTIKCSKCSAECGDQAKFCNSCGNPLQKKCPSCGVAVHPGDKFCGSCGAAQNVSEAVSESLEGETNSYDGPWRMTEVVEEWGKSVGLDDGPKRDLSDGTSSCSFSGKVSDHKVDYYLESYEGVSRIELYCYLHDCAIPIDQLIGAQVFIQRLNNDWAMGHMQIFERKGSIVLRYVLGLDGEDVVVEKENVSNLLAMADGVIKKFFEKHFTDYRACKFPC